MSVLKLEVGADDVEYRRYWVVQIDASGIK